MSLLLLLRNLVTGTLTNQGRLSAVFYDNQVLSMETDG